VAPPAQPEEDEWEWEIALARARVAADDIEVAAQALMAPAPRRTRQDTVPPPTPKFIQAKTLPMGSPPRDPMETGDWPKTEPLSDIDYADYTSPASEIARAPLAAKPVPRTAATMAVPPVRTTATISVPPARTTAPMPAVEVSASGSHLPRAKSPTTIIPVPKLPRITNAHVIQPVVSPRRFAKATPQPGYVASDADITATGIPVAKPAAKLVVVPEPIRPAEEDRTSPIASEALPRIPSLKRTAAR
jgi:hypothetical protein